MELLTKPEVSEMKNPESNGYKGIKPETNITPKEAKGFWNKVFEAASDIVNDVKEKLDDHYTSRAERMDFATRSDGTWMGEPGDSKFVPTDKTDEGVAAREKLSEYGMDGIKYKDGIPDFSKLSAETVKIDMTYDRPSNFSKAYKAVAEKWNSENKDNRNNWTLREVKEWRQSNGLTPHECSDMKTVMFVPTSVHEVVKHYGGVAECKAKNKIEGGAFDE